MNNRWWHLDDSDQDVLAFLVSLSVHVFVLVFLACIFSSSAKKEQVSIVIQSPVAEEEVDLTTPEEIVVSDEPMESGTEGSDGSDIPQSVSPVFSDLAPVSLENGIDLPVDHSSEIISAQDLVANVGPGGSEASAKGSEGAMDILAALIDSHLEQRPTVVCWLFDQSVSLVGQRKDIASRLDKVFLQVNNPGLRNMVVSFGEKINFVVKTPTKESEVVVDAIKNIPVDDSGAEMTFAAIAAAAESAKQIRSSKNNVMIVVFTDEVGNDVGLCEKVAHYCRNVGVSVYVVGIPAPFGTSEVKIKYVEFDPKYAQDVTWAVVNQGPESRFPEFVRLSNDDAVDSGFGPFHLSKICADTGGMYLRIHANSGSNGRVSDEETAPMASRLRMFFDPDVMRGYRPDYGSPERLEREIKSNQAKKALVIAASETAATPIQSPKLVFPKKDEGTFVEILSEAQKASAKVQPMIDKASGILLAGLPDRDKIEEKRWRAGYDLSLGRLLAAKVRADAYNLMLAKAKSGLKFEDKNSDTWELVPSNELSVGSQTEKIAKQAKALLEKVAAEHPGTPWAYYASEDLKIPLGYEWVERHTGVNKKDMPAGGNNPPAPRKDDQKKMLAPPKRNLKNI
jgi:hypothetical protein